MPSDDFLPSPAAIDAPSVLSNDQPTKPVILTEPSGYRLQPLHEHFPASPVSVPIPLSRHQELPFSTGLPHDAPVSAAAASLHCGRLLHRPLAHLSPGETLNIGSMPPHLPKYLSSDYPSSERYCKEGFPIPVSIDSSTPHRQCCPVHASGVASWPGLSTPCCRPSSPFRRSSSSPASFPGRSAKWNPPSNSRSPRGDLLPEPLRHHNANHQHPLLLSHGPQPVTTTVPPFPVDAAGPQQPSDDAEVLRQQISFLIKAWMADRQFLDPCRRRSEDEICRMRVSLHSERDAWTREKTVLEHRLQLLEARVNRLQEENAILRVSRQDQVSDAASAPLVSALEERFYRPMDPSTELAGEPENRVPQLAGLPAYHYPTVGLISVDGASCPHGFSNPRDGHLPSHGLALEPRTEPRNPGSKDFLAPAVEDDELPTPIIDVHEIDPKLEGIRIKAKAVKKLTFAAPRTRPPPNSVSPTRVSSETRCNDDAQPPDLVARHPSLTREGLALARGRIPSERRASSRDLQTIQVLAAKESRRLTMHAGHTPNHSLSLLPTMTVLGAVSGDLPGPGAGSSSGTRSDISEGESGASRGDCDDGSGQDCGLGSGAQPAGFDLGPYEQDGAGSSPEPELKEPLMIKNIPAQDDVFLARLDQKLESIIRDQQDALPSVLQTTPEEEDETVSGNGPWHGRGRRKEEEGAGRQPQPQHGPASVLAVSGGDATNEDHTAAMDLGAVEVDGDDGVVDAEIPLRFKKTNNFGAPFGAMHN